MWLTILSDCRYGDIIPTYDSKWELIVAICSEVIGTTLFAYVISGVISIMLNLNPGEKSRKQHLHHLNEFMMEFECSEHMRRCVRRHMMYHKVCMHLCLPIDEFGEDKG